MPHDKATVMALLGITDADRNGAKEPTWNGLFECIPPAYTEYIGRRLIEQIGLVAA